MRQIDIVEVIANAIEDTIFKSWHHEGFIDYQRSDWMEFEIDGKKYSLHLAEREGDE